MDTRKLGPDLTVSALGLGCMGMTWAYGATDADRDEIVPTPGTKRRSRLEENAGAAELALSDDEQRAIAAALPQPSGPRYPEAMMQRVSG